MEVTKSLKLNTGANMPAVGLGTWDLAGHAYDPVMWAFAAGYRHIDTAALYATEEDIGHAVRNSGIPREEIFLTTKVWVSDMGFERTKKAFDDSMWRLGLEYVDLYLIHWPSSSKNIRKETWLALEEIFKSGRAKAIGVSNYGIDHLKEMDEYANIAPAANQFETHPFWNRKDLIEYCQARNIAVVNYSPLVRVHNWHHPTLLDVAAQAGKSVPQVLLRWGLQHGCAVIPKSGVKQHIEDNIALFDFELSDEHMAALDSLNKNESVVH